MLDIGDIVGVVCTVDGVALFEGSSITEVDAGHGLGGMDAGEC